MRSVICIIIIILMCIGCHSSKEKGLSIKKDFTNNKDTFNKFKNIAWHLSTDYSINPISRYRKLGITNEKEEFSVFIKSESYFIDSLPKSSYVNIDLIKSVINFMKKYSIDYLSSSNSVFTLGYFNIHSRSDIYLHYTDKIDSVYNGKPGILSISELIGSSNPDEWAEQIDSCWYIVAIRKNL